MDMSKVDKRGIYTIVKDGAWKVLLLYTGSPEPQQLNANFVTEAQAEKFMKENTRQLDLATKKAFHMAWQSQKMMHGSGARH